MLSLKIDSYQRLNILSPSPNYPYALASSVTHPSDQCRLETAYAGVICKGKTSNGCLAAEKPIEASRPLCWSGLGFLLNYELKLYGKKQLI